MNDTLPPAAAGPHHLCFRPLAGAAATLSFRCDAAGHVDLDSLDRRERLEYLYARALIGRDFVRPCVVAWVGSGQ
jgi:hypothetical protein